MKRSQFTKQNIKIFRNAVQKALDATAEECGVTFHVGNITYNSQSCDVKVKVTNILDGKVQVQEEIDFIKHAVRYGFKPEDLGRTFVGDNGQQCTLTGLLPSRHKYPMQYKINRTGKVYITTPMRMKRMLGEELYPDLKLEEVTITDVTGS